MKDIYVCKGKIYMFVKERYIYMFVKENIKSIKLMKL